MFEYFILSEYGTLFISLLFTLYCLPLGHLEYRKLAESRSNRSRFGLFQKGDNYAIFGRACGISRPSKRSNETRLAQHPSLGANRVSAVVIDRKCVATR
jgi:hypothetical protein